MDAAGPTDAATDAPVDAAPPVADPCPAILGCVPVDSDGDGHGAPGCGDDCDDAQGGVRPGAPDSVGDGIDQSCDGMDGKDGDGDGHASTDSGGDDCDDADAGSYPDANDNQGWSFELILTSESAVRYSSLALDDAGLPHVAISRFITRECMPADKSSLESATEEGSRRGGLWQFVSVDSVCSELRDEPAVIAVDAAGVARLAYQQGGQAVRYAVVCGGSSATEAVAERTARWPALALDDEGVAHIVFGYRDPGSTSSLRHGARGPVRWELEDVAAGEWNTAPSLLVDSTGGLRATYVASSDADQQAEVRYVAEAAGSWSLEIVASADGTETEYDVTSIAVDPASGEPRAAFGSSDGVLYSARRAGVWQTVVVDPTARSGHMNGCGAWLALGRDGLPRIAYENCRADVQRVYFASVDAVGIWTLEDVASGADATSVPVALDRAGGAHIVFFQNGTGLLYGVRRVGLDGVDQNCDGVDGVDADGDGRASIETGGDDPDDG